MELPLISWAREREQIRKRKEAGKAPPWTNDPILQRYRFTNVRRRDDRVSRWLIKHVLTRHQGFSPWSFLQFTALCRWINWPPTIAALQRARLWPKSKLNLPAMARCIEDRVRHGRKTWTGAYVIPAPRDDRMSKGEFICEVVVGGLIEVESRLLAALSRREASAVWQVLYSLPGWGPFMSGQVVADWSYTRLLGNARDLYSWAPQGPGSVRGYNRLLGLPLNEHAPDMAPWCDQLQSWRWQLIDALGPAYEDLTLMDVQNCLCEVDKYCRVKNEEGRPRALYRPEMAY